MRHVHIGGYVILFVAIAILDGVLDATHVVHTTPYDYLTLIVLN